MRANKKVVFKTTSLLLLLIVGFFLIKEIKHPQLFQKRATGGLSSDEVVDNGGPANLQIVGGALMTFAETASGASTSPSGEESRLTLPSVQGFTSNVYTGTSEVAYPIITFPGLGGLTPSVSLNYSSGAVDDLHLYQRNGFDEYTTQAEVAGLGWELGGVSFIARDNTTHPNSFFLVFPGGSTKLFRVGDEWSPTWQSNPKLFVKVHHLTNNTGAGYYDTNTWKITTQDGTEYTFGSPLENDGRPIDEAITPLTITKGGSCDGGNSYLPYKWYLREVTDVNGNKIVYEYDKDWASHYYGACTDRGFTIHTYLTHLKYNNVGGEYKTVIELDYETRPDVDTIDYIRYRRLVCQEQGRADCNPGNIQFRVAFKRLKEIRVLVNSQLARKYTLAYQMSLGRKTIEEIDFHPGHSLLKEIKQFGNDGASLPPYSFAYSTGGLLNNVYLTSADNGYGGRVSYEYSPYDIIYCKSDRTCDGGNFGAVRSAVTKITVDDGEGNFFQKTYVYDTGNPKNNPRGLVKTMPDSSAVDDCNQCKAECDAANSTPEERRSCYNKYCTGGRGDFCGYPQPFTGFEFLGFGTVTENIHAMNNPSRIEASLRSYFHQVLKNATCYEPDPRKGRSYKTEILSPGSAVLTATESFYDPARTDDSCRSDSTRWENESIFVKQVQTNNRQVDPSIGNKVTTTKTSYHESFGLVTKVENLGEVDVPGDEQYSFTEYVANEDKWIIKPKETWISDIFSGANKYQQTLFFYDGNGDNAQPPTKGLLTKKTLINDAQRINTTYEYLANGQPKKTIDPLGEATETFYDNILGIFPVAVKNALNQVARTEYWGKDFILGVPTVQKDIAERITKNEYDGFGRVRAVYNPSEADPKQPETTPSATYEYFDNLAKPYVRIRSKVFEENYQINDQIYNGLGWLLQNQVLSALIDEEQTGDKREKGLITQIKYNSRGQKIEESLPFVVASKDRSIPPALEAITGYDKTITIYDTLGRAVSVTDALDRTSYNEYQNFETRIIDAAGHTATAQTDGLGRTIATFGYQGDFGASSGKRINAQTTYDVLDNPLQVIQSFPDNPGLGPLTTSSTYDRLGRKTEINDPDLGRWSFVYDDKSRVISQTDAKGQRIAFEYDALDRMTKKIYPGKPYSEALTNDVEFKYDNQSLGALGKRWRMDDLTGYTQWEYDPKGRISKMIKVVSKNITGDTDEIADYEYSYFPTDQVKTSKYPDGEVLNYTYDKYGNQQTITGQDQYLADISLSKFGTPTKVVFGHGFSQNLVYDTINRLDTLMFSDGDRRLYRDEFSRDSLSNILGINYSSGDGTSENFTYTYDSLSQLKNVRGAFAASYEYDEAGNMKVKNEDSNITIAYSNDFPVHAPKQVNGVAYRYDPNGNLLEDESRLYEWDYDNKPLKITMKQSGAGTSFFYDGEGERVAKKGTLSGINPSCSGGDQGNLNCSLDGKIDQADLVILLDYWTGDGEVKKEAEGTHTSDLNGDKKVNEIDYSILLKNWMQSFVPVQTPQTILYFPSYEKVVGTQEVNKYYSVGSISLQRIIKTGQNKLYYLIPDSLGSTRVIADSDKSDISYLSYYPFGKIRVNPPAMIPREITNFYTGQKQDSETDLYYYHARYYNPTIGHFISADKAEGPNRYAYVGNNPINNTDPTGNFCLFGLFGNCNSTWKSWGIHQATSQQAAAIEANGGTPMGKFANQYGPSLALGSLAERISGLDIPVLSDMAGQYSLAAQQAIVGAETGDTQMQLNSAYNLATVAGNAYFLGQIGEYAYQTGKATYNYYKTPSFPEVYTKYTESSVDPIRFGKAYSGGGVSEFENLVELHGATPNAVVRPGSLLKNNSGKVIGYNMEYINGRSLKEVIDVQGHVPRTVFSEIESTVGAWQQRGLAHGDLNPNNIFMTSRGIKIIDPVGWGESIPGGAVGLDLEWLQKYSAMAR